MSVDQRDLPLDKFKPCVQFYAVRRGTSDYDLICFGLLSMICDDNDLNNAANFIEVQGNLKHDIILRSRIREPNNYEKQKGSIIVWCDSQVKDYSQLALSFESDKECDFFWKLICEKIGKNYLDISGRDPLIMPREDNLPYVLDRTINARDLVQHHILNSNDFFLSLHKVFLVFQQQANRKGLSMLGRIVDSILANVDPKLLQVLFRDPLFDIILDIEKSVHKIDFEQVWRNTMKVKILTGLDPEVNAHVQIYHRVQFYRENILYDYIKSSYLEHILVMTHTQCCKGIISRLTKDNTIETLLQIKYTPSLVASLDSQQCEEETYSPEVEAIRRRQTGEKQMQFLIEAFMICRQVQSGSTRAKFIDKIYKANLVETIAEYMDLNIVKSMDLLTCIAQAAPQRFLDYLKTNYQQQPCEGVYVKLMRKFYFSGEEFQLAIMEIVKSLRELFLIKENLDFFASTFIAFNFQAFRQEKGLLILLSEAMQMVSNVTVILEQVMKHSVFLKLATFGSNLRQDKQSEIRIGKVIKLVLQANEGENMLESSFGDEVNQQVVESGLFQSSMRILEKNIRHNNIVSSSLLQNIKIIGRLQKITPYHHHLQLYYANNACLNKYLQSILSFIFSVKKSDESANIEEEPQSTVITDKMIPQAKIEPQIAQDAGERYKRIREPTVEGENECANIQSVSKKIKTEGEPAPTINVTKYIGQHLEGNQ